MPTAERVFELSLHGLNLPALTIKVPELRLTAQLGPGTPLRLKVRVKDVTEQQADALANKVAQTLYRRFLVRFGGRIDRSEPPWTASMVGKGTSKTFVVAPAIFNLSQREIDDLANDVALRVIAEEVPTAGQLYTAIDMYAAGLESQNDSYTRKSEAAIQKRPLLQSKSILGIFRMPYRGYSHNCD